MLQTGLAAAFGFSAALFVVLLFAPAIARRVSELTWRQAIRVLPQSSEEIAAARDHLRGQNAIEMRQLEMKMEKVAERERQLRIGKQGFEDRISALIIERQNQNSKIEELASESAILSRDLNIALQNNALLTTENADRDVRLASLSADFANLRNDHTRQVAAFGLMQEANLQLDQRLDALRSEASALRSKVSAAESEMRMARTEAKRHEGDAKLTNRKVAALEGKLERSIKLIAETEEKLERREAELKRLKDQTKATPMAVPLSNPTKNTAPLKPVSAVDALVKSGEIVSKIATLRPALRAAKSANAVERARLKDEMVELAGRVTAEAALQSTLLKSKIVQLKPGSALANAILKHNKAAE